MPADETLLTQLVQNLFANALKYNIQNGWVQAKLAVDQGTLKLCIENTAGPLSPEIEAQAFERFFRGDKSRSRQTGGFGLGLSICQEIAHLHKGKMSLKVTPKNTFLVCFVAPASQQAAVNPTSHIMNHWRLTDRSAAHQEPYLSGETKHTSLHPWTMFPSVKLDVRWSALGVGDMVTRCPIQITCSSRHAPPPVPH